MGVMMLTIFFSGFRRWLAAFFQPSALIARLWAWTIIAFSQNLSLVAGLGTGLLIGIGLSRRPLVSVHHQPAMVKETTFSEKETLALQEIKEMYAQGMDAVEVLANKATSLLANSGLILTLFGILQLALLKLGQPVWYQIGLALVIGLYAAAVILFLIVLAPRNYRMAFVADWEGVDKAILKLDAEKVLLQLMANYLERIQHNDSIHHRNVVCYQWAIRLFGITTILLVALSLFAQR